MVRIFPPISPTLEHHSQYFQVNQTPTWTMRPTDSAWAHQEGLSTMGTVRCQIWVTLGHLSTTPAVSPTPPGGMNAQSHFRSYFSTSSKSSGRISVDSCRARWRRACGLCRATAVISMCCSWVSQVRASPRHCR